MFFIDVQRVSPVINSKPNNSGMDKSLLNDKYLSVCLSVHPSAYEELINDYIVCDFIYSIQFGDGTVYILVHTNPSKNHRALDNALKLIDARIGQIGTESNFKCISNVLSKKVKTFFPHQHASDEHFRAIFSNTTAGGRGKRKLQEGVRTWTPTGSLLSLAG